MKTYWKIVVGTDFSTESARGVAVAVDLARRCEARCIILTHVVHHSSVLPLGLEDDDPDTQRAVARAEEELGQIPVPDTSAEVRREVRVGPPARELSNLAEQVHADLVVVASRGVSGLAALVLGSVANALIRVASCPVLVVEGPREVPPRFQSVLAAVDLSPISFNVLENALSVAAASSGVVRVLSLAEPRVATTPDDEGCRDAREERARQGVNQLLTRMGGYGVPLEVEVHHRTPVPAGILEAARAGDVDLIVLGTSGRNAWHRMILGSTTQHVVTRAPCPVLVVPPHLREPVKGRSELLVSPTALPDEGLEGI